MKLTLIFIFILGSCLMGCESKEKQALRATIDSLQQELHERETAQQLLIDMGVLLDSIDESRNLIRANMVKSETDNSYIVRLRNINRYVREMETKMYQLEQSRQRAKIRSSVEHPGWKAGVSSGAAYSSVVPENNIQHSLYVNSRDSGTRLNR